MQVVMVGATGRHGHFVLEELVARKVAVRALVRTEEAAEKARRSGASDTVIADLNEPASLAAAVAGMEGVFHIGPGFAPNEAAMGVAMVDAARQAGVRKFVFSGVIHPAISAMVNHAAKLPVEEALFTSGMDFTVLQPAVFMQFFETTWDDMVNSGRLSFPYSVSSKMSWVDYRDVAEAAALALVGDDLSYGTFELSAEGPVDGVEVAGIASKVLGRQITANQISPEEMSSSLPQGRLPDGVSRMIDHYNHYGLPGGNPLVLRTILGREPRTLSDYFRERASR